MKHRSEQEMMQLILGTAEKDERIRAVWMNGSRANPYAPKDQYQDYDIVYAVREMGSFIDDPHWIDRFGDRVIMQTRSDQLDSQPPYTDWYIYLCQFIDGNRIDLTLVPAEKAGEGILSDRMCRVLLDKDGTLPEILPADESGYWVKKPTEREYLCTCNEFWWVATYVVKGIWRQEMPYAHGMMNEVVRPMLQRMVEWKIGVEHDFQVNPGKMGKYIERYLYSDQWRLFAGSFCGGNYDDMLRGLFSMCELFRLTGREVGKALGYAYPEEDDRRTSAYLRCGGRFERIEELLNEPMERK